MTSDLSPHALPSPDWTPHVLRALDPIAVAWCARSGKVLWRSPRFDTLLGEVTESLLALCRRLPGLAAAIAAGPGPSRAVALQCADRVVDGVLHVHADGVAVLRLEDRTALAQATQRHLEDREQLLFTSRLLSIGEMATTLAHEINQPIGAAANLLRGSVMRLQRRSVAAPGDDVEGLLQALQRATEQVLYASRVVARIREYTHLHTPRRQPVEVCALLRACVSLLDWETDRESIAVALELPTQALWTLADETMLQQLFVNLLRNAIDAVRGNPAGQRLLAVSVRADGPQLEVTVRDNGCGLSEQAEKALFVPFVSSKPTGTGIGLNICRSFVELHHGRLWFTRNEGAGTSFHAALARLPAPPVVDASASENALSENAP